VTAALPIRSALLVAGHDEERLRAAAESAADAVYVDLEGGVPRADLARARVLVDTHAHRLTDAAKLVVVRVNPIASGETADDVAAAVRAGVYGIALAKIERPRDVAIVDRLLAAAEADAGRERGTVVVHPLIESARAVHEAYGIACASTRVAHMGGIVAPGGDLARSIGFRGTPTGRETEFVRARVLVDARAAGVRFPLGGIPIGRDRSAVRRFAEDARDLGYEGLLIGARSHAPVVNEVFTPTADDVDRWRRLASGDGAGRREPDVATVAWARERLAVAERFGVPTG